MAIDMKLPKRQGELLERVCLKRYRVVFDHYMGSFRPNESVRVYDEHGDPGVVGGSVDASFRPSTAEALRSKGLVRYTKTERYADHSILKPTSEGLDAFAASGGIERARRAMRANA